MDIQSIQQSQAIQPTLGQATKTTKATNGSFLTMFNSLQGSSSQLADMWKSSFEENFSQITSQYFYHVMDVPKISDTTWEHNDFPYDKLTQENIDSNVFSWQPTRGNPNQLDAKVQAKNQAMLGKNTIIVPPALEEKMQQNPKLAQKVAANIERIYEIHRPMPHLPMPGTKFYGTKMYGSVIILNEDGDVEHSCVTSGGGIVGPDEKTLRQFEAEQAKKQKRREEKQHLAQEATIAHIDQHIDMMRFLQHQKAHL
jgi:hypothetical protein